MLVYVDVLAITRGLEADKKRNLVINWNLLMIHLSIAFRKQTDSQFYRREKGVGRNNIGIIRWSIHYYLGHREIMQ